MGGSIIAPNAGEIIQELLKNVTITCVCVNPNWFSKEKSQRSDNDEKDYVMKAKNSLNIMTNVKKK